LTAQAEDAGQRQACPHCGKTLKVPGTTPSPTQRPAVSPPEAAKPTPAPSVAGLANIAVRCPVCGTRLYATREQAGKSLVCPDCLETVAVPPASPGAPARQAPPSAGQSRSAPSANSARPPAASPSPTAPKPDDGGGDDDLKLSAPIEIPAEHYLPQGLSDLLRETAGPAAQDADDEMLVPPTTAREEQLAAHDEYSIKCPVCDTLLYATEDKIGQQMTCPDCYSVVEITPPRPKPRRVNEVLDTDYEGQLFALSEPVAREVYETAESGQNPRTLGEQALRNAEREYDRQATETYELPSSPLWTGLFRFLPHAAVVLRFLVAAMLLGALVKLTMATVAWSSAGGAEWFLALIGTTALVALAVLSVILIGGTCLTILQDSANGQDEITQWPTGGPLELAGDALAFAMAVFYSILPGLALFGLAGALGMPWETRWIFLGLSVYLFFPPVQMSILESDSLSTPLSQPIVASIRHEFLLWFTFYLSSFALALLVAITLAGLRLQFPTIGLMFLSALWVLALFLYFRLLGRLAWACQVRPLEKSDEDDKADDVKSP
jgi:DNA-directed RNA polymerase subunit M/transcription elongation factor TFIIS